jgi:glycosyltransferase involved in cell wall biosynthesis
MIKDVEIGRQWQKRIMPKILINGYFFCRKLTGIERYAMEITRRLDKLSQYHEIAIIPSNAPDIPRYKICSGSKKCS